MIKNNTNNRGASPIIGVILLIVVFVGLISILSFNIFSTGVGEVDKSYDINTNIEEHSDGIIVSVLRNENVDRLIIRHEDGSEIIIDEDMQSSYNAEFGPGKYQLIGERDNNQRVLSQKRIYKQILNITVPEEVSTNENVAYDIETNFDENEIDSYNWNFGDGTISTEENPDYEYTESDIYNIEIDVDVGDEEVSNNTNIIVDSTLPNPTEPDDTQTILDNMDGDGTESSPYIIMDDYDLQAIVEELDADYKLGRNIDASKTINWNNNAGFNSIGDDNVAFTGSLDGDSHIIEGIGINRASTSYIGLFGKTDSSMISNIGIENADITGQSEVGILVGESIASDIQNSYSTGDVVGEGSFRTGGLVGYHKDNSTISESYSNVTIQSNGNNIGGLTGKNEGSQISKSYSIGNLNGEDNNIGGLSGANTMSGEITQSYSHVDITGSGNTYVGGVIGYNKQGNIDRIYGTGLIDSDGTIGGLIGNNEDMFADSYWDEQSTALSVGIGSDSGNSENIIGLNTDEMQGESAEINMDIFNFTDIWRTNTEPDDYPILR